MKRAMEGRKMIPILVVSMCAMLGCTSVLMSMGCTRQDDVSAKQEYVAATVEVPRAPQNIPVVHNRTADTFTPVDSVGDSLGYRTAECSGYHPFPYPARHTGLPYLHDAFADHEAEHAWFVGMHRGKRLDKSLFAADSFAPGDGKTTPANLTHRFLCVFRTFPMDQTRQQHSNSSSRQFRFSESIPVLSEAVHPVGFGDMPLNKENTYNYVLRCRIPEPLRKTIQAGQSNTRLFVDLHALADAEDPSWGGDASSRVLDEASPHTIAEIPLCHATSTGGEGPVVSRPNQFQLVAHTRVVSVYKFGKRGKPVQEDYRLREWIDYHHEVAGFDHFVIYDNNPEDHGQLEELLRPYIEKGLVTRVWNPTNSSIELAQGAAGVSAALRFGFAAEYFANMDPDEFMVLRSAASRGAVSSRRLGSNVTNLLELCREILERERPHLDGFKLAPNVMTYCNGTVFPGSPGQGHRSELEKKCPTGNRKSGPKQVFKGGRVWIYHTHHAFLTSDWTKPKIHLVPQSRAFLAHFRRGNYGGVAKLTPGDIVLNEFKNPIDEFDAFLENHRHSYS